MTVAEVSIDLFGKFTRKVHCQRFTYVLSYRGKPFLLVLSSSSSELFRIHTSVRHNSFLGRRVVKQLMLTVRFVHEKPCTYQLVLDFTGVFLVHQLGYSVSRLNRTLPGTKIGVRLRQKVRLSGEGQPLYKINCGIIFLQYKPC